MAKLEIRKDDPLFLILLCFDNYYELTNDLAEAITAERKATAQKAETIHRDTQSILEAANSLNTRLKQRVPRTLRDSGLLIKELTIATSIAFLAGGLFLQPMLKKTISFTCSSVPTICTQDP